MKQIAYTEDDRKQIARQCRPAVEMLFLLNGCPRRKIPARTDSALEQAILQYARTSGYSFEEYLLRITEFMALNEAPYLSPVSPKEEAAPEWIYRKSAQNKVMRQVSRFPKRIQEVFLLCDVLFLSDEQAGKILKLSPASLASKKKSLSAAFARATQELDFETNPEILAEQAADIARVSPAYIREIGMQIYEDCVKLKPAEQWKNRLIGLAVLLFFAAMIGSFLFQIFPSTEREEPVYEEEIQEETEPEEEITYTDPPTYLYEENADDADEDWKKAYIRYISQNDPEAAYSLWDLPGETVLYVTYPNYRLERVMIYDPDAEGQLVSLDGHIYHDDQGNLMQMETESSDSRKSVLRFYRLEDNHLTQEMKVSMISENNLGFDDAVYYLDGDPKAYSYEQFKNGLGDLFHLDQAWTQGLEQPAFYPDDMVSLLAGKTSKQDLLDKYQSDTDTE